MWSVITAGTEEIVLRGEQQQQTEWRVCSGIDQRKWILTLSIFWDQQWSGWKCRDIVEGCQIVEVVDLNIEEEHRLVEERKYRVELDC